MAQTTGCYSWHSLDKRDLTASRLEETDRWRVETTDGYEWELWSPTVRDSLLVGLMLVRGQRKCQEFPISSLKDVKERHFSWWQTGVVAGVTYLAVWGFINLAVEVTEKVITDDIKGG